MAEITREDVVKYIENMTVLELAEFAVLPGFSLEKFNDRAAVAQTRSDVEHVPCFASLLQALERAARHRRTDVLEDLRELTLPFRDASRRRFSDLARCWRSAAVVMSPRVRWFKIPIVGLLLFGLAVFAFRRLSLDDIQIALAGLWAKAPGAGGKDRRPDMLAGALIAKVGTAAPDFEHAASSVAVVDKDLVVAGTTVHRGGNYRPGCRIQFNAAFTIIVASSRSDLVLEIPRTAISKCHNALNRAGFFCQAYPSERPSAIADSSKNV